MKKKKLIFMIGIIILIIVLTLIFFLYKDKKDKERLAEQQRVELYIESIKNSYSKYVKTNKEAKLYNNEKQEIGKINKDVEITLKEKEIKNQDDDYFEIEEFDNHYIYFKDIEKIDSLTSYDNHYKEYIVFNENCVTEGKTTFYDSYYNYLYELNTSVDLPIIIKDNEFYGVEYNNRLLYLKKYDVKVKENHNTDLENAKSIPVLLYHFFHDHNRFENMTTVISMRIDKFEEELKYLTDNDFMTLKLKDLEMYVDGKIQIRENSVVITIDDGNESVYRLAYPIIEKYNINATVFAITSRDSNAIGHKTNNVEIHSHTHDMHITGKCSGGQGGYFKCINHDAGLNDLKKSREVLNNTTYLAYPFGEYMNSSIELLKEAGYTMAFTTNYGNAKVGEDKYLIPRIYIYNEYTLNQFKRIVN